MSTQATNLLLQINLLQRTNELQQINELLRPTQVIPPGGSTLNTPTMATFSFSNSQILNLLTAPVLVLSAPGAGLAYMGLWAMWEFIPGSVPYTITGGAGQSSPTLYYSNGTAPVNIVYDNGNSADDVILSGNTTKVWWSAVCAPSNEWPSIGVVNQPLYLSVPAGDYTSITGGTGSVLNLTLMYMTVEAQ
jgi:hypothetical protein